MKKNKKIIDKLDFSGGQGSYFDFWHLHVDFDGDGNRDWKTRKKFMDEQIKVFEYLKTKLADYSHSFQLWIGIDEEDSSQDGVTFTHQIQITTTSLMSWTTMRLQHLNQMN